MRDFKLIREVEGIREYELLSNGLRVLTCENHSAPVATVMVVYQTGTRNEIDGQTGSSHMLEHMMFKGTPSHNRKKGNSLFMLLQQTGAQLNATTGMDVTDFYATVPRERIPLALELEADRMRNAWLNPEDFKVEREVVLNELEMLENSPATALMKAVWRTGYQKHPYRNLAIGRVEDLKNMKAEDLVRYYNRYYWPDQAYLIVVGDFKTGELLEQVREKFSKIQRSPESSQPVIPREPMQTEARRVSVSRPDRMEAVVIAQKAPEGPHSDSYALEVLGNILGGGKTSRLYKKLVDRGLAAQVLASVSALRDPGFFDVTAVLAPGAQHEEIEKIILQTYEEIRQKGVLPDELEIAKNELKAHALYAWDGMQSIADGLSAAVAAGDWSAFPLFPEKIEAVTAQDVQRVAEKYLKNSTMTVGYLISKASEAEPSKNFVSEIKHEREITEPVSEHVLLEPVNGVPETAKLSTRAVVSNVEGIRGIILRTEARGMMTLAGSIDGAGHAYSENPVLPSMTAAMLETGTQEHDKFEIARILESRGIELSFYAESERVLFRARLPKAYLDETVRLVAEILRGPVFKQEELEIIKQQWRVYLQDQMTDTEAVASAELSRFIYPPDHPHYEPPIQEQIKALEAITLSDVKKFYDDHYGNNRFVLVAVGDLEVSNTEAIIREAFKDWKPKDISGHFARQVLLGPSQRKMIFLEGKRNLDIFFGHGLPVTRKDPEYPALALSSFALGGDFSSRLTSSVRDTLGLSYSVYSKLDGVTGDLEGEWFIHMITTAPLLEAAKQKVFFEIDRFAKGGLTVDELKRNQNTVAGQYKVGLATTHALAEQIRRAEEMGLGLAYLDDFPKIIQSLTLPEVNQAIARFFHPEKVHMVIAGDDHHESAAK